MSTATYKISHQWKNIKGEHGGVKYDKELFNQLINPLTPPLLCDTTVRFCFIPQYWNKTPIHTTDER